MSTDDLFARKKPRPDTTPDPAPATAEASTVAANPFTLAGADGQPLAAYTSADADALADAEVIDADDYTDPDPGPDPDADPDDDPGGGTHPDDPSDPGDEPVRASAAQRPPPPDDDPDDYDDVYPPPEFDHTPPPEPDGPGRDGFTGDFQSWAMMGETTHRAPTADDPADAPGGDDDDYDVPDYADPASVAAFKDRTGGASALLVRRDMQSRAVRTRDTGAGRYLLGGLAAAAVVAVVGGVIIFNVSQATDGPILPSDNTTAAAGTPAPVSVSEAAEASTLPPSWDHAVPGCTRTRNSSIVIGADPGSTDTPQEAILGFEWGYYVQRSAAHARAYVAADAKVATEAAMQREGIDQVPEGAKYCVYITAADDTGTAWDVELQEQWPGETVASWPQRITTTRTADGRHLITGIYAR